MKHAKTVAIAGFGTVGRSVARILSSGRTPELALRLIFNRDVARKKVDWVPRDVKWTERFDDVLASKVDVVVEVVGGLSPAGDWVRQALKAGKSVVTANKQLVADAGAELEALARERGAMLAFEASVGGGIPVIRSIREGLAGDRIYRIAGVLNGTCNYILTRMGDGNVTFADALREAQSLGFAEADPTDDLTGIDARAKLAILAAVGLGLRPRPADIPARSIAAIEAVDFAWARRLMCAVRQMSWVESSGGRLVAWVSPALVPEGSPFAAIRDNQNVIVTNGELSGGLSLAGLGAGADPTAVAVVSDLIGIARHTGTGPGPRPLAADFSPVDRTFTSPYYLRFRTSEPVDDPPGFRDILSGASIGVDRVLQEPGPDSDGTGAMVLAPCPFAAIDPALEALVKGLPLRERPVCLPLILGQV